MKNAAPSKDIKITRVYDAPLKAVWDAWTDADKVAQWWGPRGFTLTTYHKDLRAGGTWKYTMHGPDGTDYPNLTRYHEVEYCRKLVYDHGGTEDRPPLFRVTVIFTDVGGKTRMDMTSTTPTLEAAAEIREIIRKAGGNGTWDRLAEFLEKQSAGKEIFLIARSFEAPIERVFDAWVDPKAFAQWLPPAGYEMHFSQCDIRTGGVSVFAMSGAKGPKMCGRTRYLAIERPRRIVYAQQFCDESGNVARHPFSPTWPETMLTTVEFAEEGPDMTRVTVRWEPIEGSSEAEIKTFVDGRGGMTLGWTGSFDKLEALLARA